MKSKSSMARFIASLSVLFLVLTYQPVNAQNYNYMGSWDALGVPDYLLPNGDSLSYSFLQTIWISLPEGKPVPIYNPHYIADGFDMDVFVTDTADVFVTYAHDGAAFKNVLGYYTYDLGNLPDTIVDTNITVLFPNSSQLNKGGGLLPGDKLYVGRFMPNTGIGWVILADGFVNSNVTPGRWTLYSNPDWNPEPDTSIRKHNTILKDTTNELLLIGFEDIRRDSLTSPFGGCDNDFNDVVFYVTADDFSSIDSGNYNDFPGPPGGVTTGNNGGIESNGTLAHKIADRNFQRLKNPSSVDYDNYNTLTLLSDAKIDNILGRNIANTGLIDFIPDSTVLNAKAYISTPEDLINSTNAIEVFAVDYITPQSLRVSAILATRTEDGVYEHTKPICDRLTGSELLEIDHIEVMGHWFIISKMKQPDGSIEYVSGFNTYVQDGNFEIDNHWNVLEYDVRENNYNFQVWAGNESIVRYLLTDIILLMQDYGAVTYLNTDKAPVPEVFVKKGLYESGNLILEIINNNGSSHVELFGTYTASETSPREDVFFEYSLSGDPNELVVIPTGGIFDIGLSIMNNIDPERDVVYFADGPWGLDFIPEGAVVDYYEVFPEEPVTLPPDNTYPLERDISVSGSVIDYISVYRSVFPGNVDLDCSAYNGLSFEAFGSHPVEITIVKKGIQSWADQFRKVVLLTDELQTFEIPFTEFTSTAYQQFTGEDVVSVVFSIVGNGSAAEFDLSSGNLAFIYKNAFGIEEMPATGGITVHPNPFSLHTYIGFDAEEEEGAIMRIYDVAGRMMKESSYPVQKGKNTLMLKRNNLESGMYILELTLSGKKMKTNLLIR